MFCQECGALVPDGTTFCDDCTRRIASAVQPAVSTPAQGQQHQYGQPGQGQAQPQGNGPSAGMPPDQPYFAPGDAFAQRPGGAVAPPPPLADYQQHHSQSGYQYPRSAPVGQSAYRRTLANRQALIALAISGACGLVIFISTFLPWISFGGLFNASGWSYMVNSGQMGGNFVWFSGGGVLFFTGVFSILVGLVVVAGVALFFFKGLFIGVRTAQVAGGIGAVLALINMITLYTRLGGSGFGMWVCLVFCIAAAISAELGIKALS